MSEIEELVLAANNLCKTIEKTAENEKKFCHNVQLILEQYSWEVYKMTNELKEINYRWLE